jgi:hypothetical protein
MTWASDIKSFLMAGYLNLPLALAGTMLILGLLSANYAILFLLFGFLIVTPVVSTASNMIFDLLISLFGSLSPSFGATLSSLLQANRTDMCDLIIPFPSSASSKQSTSVTTTWMSMVTFVLAYLLFNAIELLNRTPEYPPMATDDDKKQIDQGASLRVSQAMMSIIMIVVLALILFFVRIRSGCETVIGSLITIALFTGIARAWFKMLSSVGDDRLSDIFGIANRLLTPDAMTNAPVACLPVANA